MVTLSLIADCFELGPGFLALSLSNQYSNQQEVIFMDAAQLAILDAEIAFIEAHPEKWDQRSWTGTNACGTTFCVAGNISHDFGATRTDGKWAYFDRDKARKIMGIDNEYSSVDWPDFASFVLGVEYTGSDDDEAMAVFFDYLNLDGVKYGRDWLAQRYGLPLKYNDEVDPEWNAASVQVGDWRSNEEPYTDDDY
jgi:hypothetical protein